MHTKFSFDVGNMDVFSQNKCSYTLIWDMKNE